MLSPLHFDIITDVKKISTETILCEIFDNNLEKICEKLSLDISESFITKIQNRPEKQDFAVIYPENSAAFQVVLFFVNQENQKEKRIEFLRKFAKNVTFIPANNFDDALEFFALTTYNFSLYKTEKIETKQLFFVEDMSKLSNVDNQLSLIQAIITARTLVNRSPNDVNPESLVKSISEHNWRHFDVEILNSASLREHGCNLIRAVGQ